MESRGRWRVKVDGKVYVLRRTTNATLSKSLSIVVAKSVVGRLFEAAGGSHAGVGRVGSGWGGVSRVGVGRGCGVGMVGVGPGGAGAPRSGSRVTACRRR